MASNNKTQNARAVCVGLLAMLGLAVASAPYLQGLDGGKEKSASLTSEPVQQEPVGYTDTPFLPGGKWRVHDPNRPHPRVVDPGTAGTPEKPGIPPSDAIVLFDGRDLSHWEGQGPDKTPKWKIEKGYMEVVPGSSSIVSKEKFGDCQIHVEWASPEKVQSNSQGRGNSGVLIMSRYEIQVLDSYQNLTYADGQASAIYGQWPPLVNASRRPGEWQTYDIAFEAPRFADGKVVKPAYVTVLHNGVLVHNHQEIMGPVRHRELTRYEPHGVEEPLLLQCHNNPVRYRSVWVRKLRGYDQPEK